MKKSRLKKEQIMVYFIALIMISSVFGVIFYGFSDSDTTAEYLGYRFSKDQGADNRWKTEINGKKLLFDYFPSEVESINITSAVINRLSQSVEIDFTYDENSSQKEMIAYSGYSMQEQLSLKNVFVRMGFTDKSQYKVPVIKCEQATPQIPVLYFLESNQTKISVDGDCLIIEAKSEFDFLRIKDRILYGIYGIIE